MSLDDEKNSQSVFPFIGLKNKGNTCYLNSILQVLYYCPSFGSKLSSTLAANLENSCCSLKEESNNILLLIKELKNVFSHLDNNQDRLIKDGTELSEDEIKDLSAVCPQDFIECLRNLYPVFEPYTQQDAQECFHCILNICNSVISLKSDVSFYNGTESKVVGGRRSHSVAVLTSNQNRESNSSSNASSVRFSKTAVKSDANKTGKGQHQKENMCTFDTGGNSNREVLSERSPTVGCFKGLKRRRLKLGGKDQPSYEKLHKGLSDPTQEKENQNVALLSASSEGSSEPAPKKSRLGSTLRVASSKQPNLLKSLWKTKTERIFNKHTHSHDDNTAVAQCAPDAILDPIAQPPVESAPLTIPSTSKADINKTAVPCDFIEDMFHGQLVTTIRCMECESEVRRYESFQDVSLPVKNIQPSVNTDGIFDLTDESRANRKVETCSLSWALDRYTSTETLCGDNKYFCDVCMRLTEGERCMRFYELPPVVTLHLKRFSTSPADSSNFSSTVSKITSALEIPSTVEFSEWCSPDCLDSDREYDLFGIVIHSGLTITGGHYLSYVKYVNSKSPEKESLSSYDGQWLEMDDERARLLSEEEMQKALYQGDFNLPTKSAYMLFYHRKP